MRNRGLRRLRAQVWPTKDGSSGIRRQALPSGNRIVDRVTYLAQLYFLLFDFSICCHSPSLGDLAVARKLRPCDPIGTNVL